MEFLSQDPLCLPERISNSPIIEIDEYSKGNAGKKTCFGAQPAELKKRPGANAAVRFNSQGTIGKARMLEPARQGGQVPNLSHRLYLSISFRKSTSSQIVNLLFTITNGNFKLTIWWGS